MIQSNKFEDLTKQFTSLGIEMTQMNKFENLNCRFTSLGIRMVQTNKFKTTSGLYSKKILCLSYSLLALLLLIASFFVDN